RPIGFVHAGFGPNEAGDGLDCSTGVTQMLMVRPSAESPELTQALLHASEDYLRSRGAKVLYGGGMHPLDPFYLGLYGGSELSGVLGSDERLNEVFQQSDYDVAARAIVLHLELARLKPIVSREVRTLRRDIVFNQNFAPQEDCWWDTVQLGEFERQEFTLTSKKSPDALARVQFWDIEPLASSWGIRTSGITDLGVAPEHRRKKLATYLLTESFKVMRKRGVSIVEAHAMQENEPALNLYRSLGFTQVDAGTVYRKRG
ncbi:MAG: GNAT family N-acetyltransferase, partial [Planctomycetales bacterium]|nr:GNAT family N-acetyltransferase [Planctomycetales bacterium]